jgi:hypothetical protein
MWGDLRTFLVPEIGFAALAESGFGRGILHHSQAALKRDSLVLRALAGLLSTGGLLSISPKFRSVVM